MSDYRWARRCWILSCVRCLTVLEGLDGEKRDDVKARAEVTGWQRRDHKHRFRIKCRECVEAEG